MRLFIALFLSLILASVPTQSAEDEAASDVKVRAYLEPEGDIYVGQLARLWIEVSTSTWFTKAPTYPELKLPGAIALMPEQLGVNFSDRVGGKTRSGQRQRYVIIPQRVGDLTIPPLTITLAVAIDGKPSDLIKIQTEPVAMAVVFPEGAEGLEQIITTDKLSVRETYGGNLEGLKVGDAVTRKVTVKAENTFALALPQVEFKSVKGTRLYPAQPKLSDKVNRGRYSAERSDAATYVLQSEGRVTLPEIRVQWWNPDSNAIEQSLLPSVSFAVATNPDHAGPTTANRDGTDTVNEAKRWLITGLLWLRANIVSLMVAAIGLYMLILVWRRFQPALLHRWRDFADRYRQSEARAFSLFRKACRSRDDSRMVNTFWHWLDQLTPGDQAASLDRLTRQLGDEAFSSFILKEGRARYSPPYTDRQEGGTIYRHVARFRQQIVGRHRQKASLDLSSLNPRSASQATGSPDAPGQK